MKNSIVLGCLFGDEGKGLMVDYLCSKVNRKINNPLVMPLKNMKKLSYKLLDNIISLGIY